MVTLSVLLVSYYCLHIFTNFQIRASFTALKLLFQYWAGIKLCAFIFVSNHISATLFISSLLNSLIITVTLHKIPIYQTIFSIFLPFIQEAPLASSSVNPDSSNSFYTIFPTFFRDKRAADRKSVV